MKYIIMIESYLSHFSEPSSFDGISITSPLIEL